MKKPVTNFEEEFRTNGLPLTELALAVGVDALVDGLRSVGQQEFAAADVLPVELLNNSQADFESLGFVFGPTERHDCLRPGKLPPGWTKKVEGSLWTNIYDQKGRQRGSIFYDSSFFDRRAHMALNKRFYCTSDYEVPPTQVARIVKDYSLGNSGAEVFRCQETVPHRIDDVEAWREACPLAEKRCTTACEEWLKSHGYPDWKNKLFYWD